MRCGGELGVDRPIDTMDRSLPAEQRSEHARGAALNASQDFKLSFVEPDTAALWTDVDLHRVPFLFLEHGPVARALVDVAALRRALRVEARTHFTDQISVLFDEVFVFVTAGLFVDGHDYKSTRVAGSSLSSTPVVSGCATTSRVAVDKSLSSHEVIARPKSWLLRPRCLDSSDQSVTAN